MDETILFWLGIAAIFVFIAVTTTDDDLLFAAGEKLVGAARSAARYAVLPAVLVAQAINGAGAAVCRAHDAVSSWLLVALGDLSSPPSSPASPPPAPPAPVQDARLPPSPPRVYEHFSAPWPAMTRVAMHCDTSPEIPYKSMYDAVNPADYGMRFVYKYGYRRLESVSEADIVVVHGPLPALSVTVLPVEDHQASPTPTSSADVDLSISKVVPSPLVDSYQVLEPVQVDSPSPVAETNTWNGASGGEEDTLEMPVRVSLDDQFSIFCQNFTAESAQLHWHIQEFIRLSSSASDYQWHMGVVFRLLVTGLNILQAIFPAGMSMQVGRLFSFCTCIERLYAFLQKRGYQISNGSPALQTFTEKVYELGQFLLLNLGPLDMAPPPPTTTSEWTLPSAATPTGTPAEDHHDMAGVTTTSLAPPTEEVVPRQQLGQQASPPPAALCPPPTFLPPPPTPVVPAISFGSTGVAIDLQKPAQRGKGHPTSRGPVKRVSQPTTGSGTAQFKSQDWTISDDALLQLTKESWGWSNGDLAGYTIGLADWPWQREASPSAEDRAAVTLCTVEARLKRIAIPLKQASTVLRLQALSNRVSVPLCGELSLMIHLVDQMMDKLVRSRLQANGDFVDFSKAVGFFMTKVYKPYRKMVQQVAPQDATSLDQKLENVHSYFF